MNNLDVIIFPSKGVRYCIALSENEIFRPIIASDNSYIDLIGPLIAQQKLKSVDDEFVARRIDEVDSIGRESMMDDILGRLLGSNENRFFFIEASSEFRENEGSSANFKFKALIYIFELSGTNLVNRKSMDYVKKGIVNSSHDILFFVSNKDYASLSNSIAEIINPLNLGFVRYKRKSRFLKVVATSFTFYLFLLIFSISVYVGRNY